MPRDGLLRYIPYTHVQTCGNVRVQSATRGTASVHTLHMSKPVVTSVFTVLCKGLLYQWVWRQHKVTIHIHSCRSLELCFDVENITFSGFGIGPFFTDTSHVGFVFRCSMLGLILSDTMIGPQNHHGHLRAGNDVVGLLFIVCRGKTAT